MLGNEPPVQNMNKIWVCPRLDEDGAITRQKKLLEFVKKYDKYYVYREVADKTKKIHYHIAIEVKDEKAYKALKQRWSDYFREIPKGEKSCQKDTTGNYHIYITKGRDRVVASGITDEELSEIESQSYEKPKKPESRSLTSFLVQEFDKDFKGMLVYDNRMEMYRVIVDWVLKKWRDEDKCLQPFVDRVVVGIVNTIVIRNSARIIVETDPAPDVLTSFRDRILLNFN